MRAMRLHHSLPRPTPSKTGRCVGGLWNGRRQLRLRANVAIAAPLRAPRARIADTTKQDGKN
eukprot:6206663-Lingulodinium_polyedra.AAC.1